MIRWLRVVLPSPGVLIVFAALYAILEGGLRFLEWRFGMGPMEVRLRPGTIVLGTGCMLHALRRLPNRLFSSGL
jgi:hypothetical protein